MKYRWFIGAGAVAAVLVAAILLWQRNQEQEPSPQDLADKIATGKPIELRDGTFRPTSPAADYFALPQGPQRTAYLDKMIDMQEQTQKKIASGEIKLPEGAQRMKPQPGQRFEPDEKAVTSINREKSADGSQERVTIRLNADDMSPTLRAQMQEFAAAMRERRKERGLDPDAPMMIIRNDVRTVSK